MPFETISNDPENKTVLITGADSFIGSHLTEALVKEGADDWFISLVNQRGRSAKTDKKAGKRLIKLKELQEQYK